MGRLVLAALCALAVTASATAAPKLRWETDKGFAKAVAMSLQDTFQNVTITCRKPVLPKKWGATAGVVQEDCLVIASNSQRVVCGEFAYDNGPLPVVEYTCPDVARAFQKDVKTSDIQHFHFHQVPVA